MKRLPTLVVTLSLFISACGTNPTITEQPEPVATQPENAEAILLDSSGKNSLYALRVNGFSDFKLYSYINNGQEKVSSLANGTDTIVLGAAFLNDPKFAYLALRKSVKGSSQDSLVLYNVESDTVEKEISNFYNQGISGTVYNSLYFAGDKLQFVAQRNTNLDKELPMPDQFELNTKCESGDCGKITEIVAGKDVAFQTLLADKLNSERSSLSGQSLSAQALAVQMYWPKGVSGHHYPGSSFHSGRDAYSLDINRDSGENDHGDPVRAAAQGKVIEVIRSTVINDYGNRVRIQHSNGAVTLYAHLSAINVASGALVTAKQSIGAVGNTGLDLSQPNVASHLHFTVYDTAGNGTYIANSYYPIYARVGGSTATCENVITDMRDGREYYPC